MSVAPNTTTVTITPLPTPPPTVQTSGSALVINGYSIDWMVIALVAALIIMTYTLYRAQKDPNRVFDVYDLVMENGRLSRQACVMMGSFVTTSWMMIQLTVNGKLTEGYLGLYSAAWIAPTVTRMIVGGNAPAVPKTETGK